MNNNCSSFFSYPAPPHAHRGLSASQFVGGTPDHLLRSLCSTSSNYPATAHDHQNSPCTTCHSSPVSRIISCTCPSSSSSSSLSLELPHSHLSHHEPCDLRPLSENITCCELKSVSPCCLPPSRAPKAEERELKLSQVVRSPW